MEVKAHAVVRTFACLRAACLHILSMCPPVTWLPLLSLSLTSCHLTRAFVKPPRTSEKETQAGGEQRSSEDFDQVCLHARSHFLVFVQTSATVKEALWRLSLLYLCCGSSNLIFNQPFLHLVFILLFVVCFLSMTQAPLSNIMFLLVNERHRQ